MYLFIFESIGTSELILIGIVALIFLGPRKLPEMARKIGKIMAEFRTTTQEFKSTWEREVNFDEEAKAFEIDLLEEDAAEKSVNEPATQNAENTIGSPEIKAIDKESFDRIAAESKNDEEPKQDAESGEEDTNILSDKRNWL
ncbi:MAG: Sec-independent protein translocase protein TatB [Pyrinomonadaceae bacterium]